MGPMSFGLFVPAGQQCLLLTVRLTVFTPGFGETSTELCHWGWLHSTDMPLLPAGHKKSQLRLHCGLPGCRLFHAHLRDPELREKARPV